MNARRSAIQTTAWPVGLACLFSLGALLMISGCPGIGPMPTECTTSADCDDNDACTTDTCGTNGLCVNTPINCDDGDECTTDSCEDGECVNEPIPGCSSAPVIELSTLSDDDISALDVTSEVTGVTIGSPPVVEFSVTSTSGAGIAGIGALWEQDNRFVRFTLTKLVPGSSGDPSERAAYTREETNDGSTGPDYDTGSALVDYGNGKYAFTFNTDVDNVSGVTYEPSLSHRVAGQIGSGDHPLPAQNLFHDFVPAGGAVTETRDIFTMSSCNECHDALNFHGRRFIAEYCVNCHTPELAQGEGDMGVMIHKIHAGHKFNVLDDGIDYSEVTYPQSLANCRKCHNAEDSITPDGDNWRTAPSMRACGSCHQISFVDPPPAGLTLHSGGAQANNSGCAGCHPASGGLAGIEDSHLTLNATPNNPNLPAGVPAMAYVINDVTVSGSGFPTVRFAITADGQVLSLTNLPDGFVDANGAAFQWPAFLMAWAEPQDGIDNPADYNNLGRSAAQPPTVSLGALVAAGGVSCSGAECVADFSATGNAFPDGATLRAIALQGYFTFDNDGDEEAETSLHTLSAVMNVAGDEVRREVVDSAKCFNCHEWFEGHGGNRVVGVSTDPNAPPQPSVCALCHVPNLSTSGRAINPATAADRDGDPATSDPSEAAVALGNSDTWTWPEHSNNLKDMIHGIHASANRTTDYEFVRNRLDGLYFNWAEVTFPGQNGTSNCLMCHKEDTYLLPLPENVLDTTVRTTATDDGLDSNAFADVGAARGSVPNMADWVNSPTASTCYMCHDSAAAVAHIQQNGGIISQPDPADGDFTQRQDGGTVESCLVCHGPGKISDIGTVHAIR